MRRNVDVIAIAIVVVVAAIWNFMGRSGLARAIASGQVQVPDHFVQVMVHSAQSPLQFHCY